MLLRKFMCVREALYVMKIQLPVGGHWYPFSLLLLISVPPTFVGAANGSCSSWCLSQRWHSHQEFPSPGFWRCYWWSEELVMLQQKWPYRRVTFRQYTTLETRTLIPAAYQPHFIRWRHRAVRLTSTGQLGGPPMAASLSTSSVWASKPPFDMFSLFLRLEFSSKQLLSVFWGSTQSFNCVYKLSYADKINIEEVQRTAVRLFRSLHQ